MIELIALVRMPSISACKFIVRLSPSSPPTASSVKPNPSWMPVPNSTEMMISREKPLEPSGILVEMMPNALSAMTPLKVSSSAPAYSPRSKSRKR